MRETELNRLNNRDFPRHALSFALLVPRAHVASHHATNWAWRSLPSYRPVMHTCSYFGARVRSRHMMREAARRGAQQVPQHFDGARAMGLSSRRRLILLASHRMALTRERKSSSRIAREIEIFSIFAWLVNTLVPKHNSRFWVFRRTICWSRRSINIFLLIMMMD